MKALFSAILLVFSSTTFAGFINESITTQYYYPNLSTPYGFPVTTTVNNSVEITDFNNYFDIDISDSQVSFLNFNFSGSWTIASFNGLKIYDTNSTIEDIVSVSLSSSSNMVGLDLSRITFDQDNIWINWNGLSFNTNTIVTLDVQFANSTATVPSPPVIALLSIGILGFSLSRRKIKK